MRRPVLGHTVEGDHGRDRCCGGNRADLDVAGPYRDAVVFDHPVGQDRRQQRIGIAEFGVTGEALQRRAEVRDFCCRPAFRPLRCPSGVFQRQHSYREHSHWMRPGSLLRSITGALRPAILLRRAMKSRCSSPYSRPLAFRKRYFSPSTASLGSNRMMSLSAVGRIRAPRLRCRSASCRRQADHGMADRSAARRRRSATARSSARCPDPPSPPRWSQAAVRCRFQARHRRRWSPASRRGRAGTAYEGIPIFDTVERAVSETGANATVIYVPPPFAADAILEAADAGVPLIICITEGVPVRDMVKVKRYLAGRSSQLLGNELPRDDHSRRMQDRYHARSYSPAGNHRRGFAQRNLNL